MKILAVDTSGASASCAVTQDGRVLAETTLNSGRTHASHLVPMIDGLLGLLGLKPADMDAFAVSVGPGSFTGLRIGAVTMKSMAYASNRPLAGISTLEAMAFCMPPSAGIVCPLLDARNRQVYAALYRVEGGAPVLSGEESGLPVEALAEAMKTVGEPVLLTGDAADLWRDFLADATGLPVRAASGSFHLTRAAAVGLLAEARIASAQSAADAGEPEALAALSAFAVNPQYLRKSQAERMKSEHAPAAGLPDSPGTGGKAEISQAIESAETPRSSDGTGTPPSAGKAEP